MAGPLSNVNNGTRLAIGIVLLWFGGACLFVAFMSGKVPALTTGTGSGGQAQGPSNASELAVGIANAVQAQEKG